MNRAIKIQRKFPKLLSQRIRKRYFKSLGTSVISPPLCLNIIETYENRQNIL